MKKKIIIGIIVILIAVLIYQIIDYFPYFMVGTPLPVFAVYNNDQNSHDVNIQIFDPNNNSIFYKTYKLGYAQPGEYSARYPENGKWKDVHEKDRLYPKGIYTFIVTMDNNISKIQKIEMDTWRMAIISINNGDISIGNPTA